MSVTQHKIVNLLKTLCDFFVTTCRNVFNVWPNTPLLLPVWHREAESSDTLGAGWLRFCALLRVVTPWKEGSEKLVR